MFGAPGAGKGTQAGKLAEMRGLPEIATRATFCGSWRSPGMPLGRVVRTATAGGGRAGGRRRVLLPIVRIGASRTPPPGYILDGFPRTPEQAEGSGEEGGRTADAVVVVKVEVPREVLMRRLSGAADVQQVRGDYNIYLRPPRREGVCDFRRGAAQAARRRGRQVSGGRA